MQILHLNAAYLVTKLQILHMNGNACAQQQMFQHLLYLNQFLQIIMYILATYTTYSMEIINHFKYFIQLLMHIAR